MLYGPLFGSNPSVLIQAPLYYRLTGLLAAPWVWTGTDPLAACFRAGRLISALSFLALLILAGRLARADGGQGGAILPALLIAGSPLMGSYPATMRPDLLGIALQTGGLALAAAVAIDPNTRAARRLTIAFGLFALAFLTKQHYIVGPIASALWLAIACKSRRSLIGPLLGACALFVAIVAGCLAVENRITQGAMMRSVFQLPGELQHVTAGSWAYVAVVFVETFKRGLPLLAMGLAAAWATSGRRWPAFDRWLLLIIAMELALMVQLCRNSSGAWFNYALQATVCFAILIGRRLAELPRTASLPRIAPLLIAVGLILAADVRLVAKGSALRLGALAERRALLADPRVAVVPETARYFTGTYQHYNRLAGDAELAHDEWLYQAFEAIDAAEPRELWLKKALTDGQVQLVVVEQPGENESAPRVAGVSEPLPELGFTPAGRSGRFDLWKRR
ncbi:MAG: glycosyltransferase family 39 protein [Isosphaeraceae bacterium]